MITRQRFGLALMFISGLFMAITALDGSPTGDGSMGLWFFLIALGFILFVAPK